MKTNNFNFSSISKFRTEIMGFACLWVVLHHFEGDISLLPLSRLSVYGNAGVDIFLFISGISLYFAFQKKEPLISFYKKRFVRLLIPYILICAPFYIWKSVCLGEGNLWLDLTQLSFPLNRMITTWYIPAMFVFYLVFPLVYLLQNNSKFKNRNIFVLSFCVFYLILLLILKDVFPVAYKNTEIALTRFIIFFIGCYLGKTVYEKKTVATEIVSFSGAYIIIWILLRETINLGTFWIRISYGPLAISVCLILSYVFEFVKKDNSLLVVLQFFGNHSLEMYLTHVIIRNIWRNILGTRFLSSNGALDYLVVVFIAVVVSIPIHFFVSKLTSLIIKK